MLGVARLETLRLLRSPIAFALLLAVPAVQVVLFGYAIRPGAATLHIAVGAPSREEADHLVDRLRREPDVHVVSVAIAPQQARDAVRAHRAIAGVDLPVTRGPDNPDAPTLPVRLTIDGTNAPLARAAQNRIAMLYWRERAERDRYAEFQSGLATERIGNPDLRDDWTFLPSLSGVIVMICSLLLGSLSIAREREGETWETLQMMPIASTVLLLGRLLPGTLIGIAQGLAVLVIAHVLFAVPLPSGTVILVGAVLPLLAAAHLALGYVLSMRARTQLAALQGAVAFYLPAMLLSGFLYPVETMPGWARALGAAFPLTHYVRAARLALLQAAEPAAIWGAAAPILPFLAVTLLAGLALLRSA